MRNAVSRVKHDHAYIVMCNAVNIAYVVTLVMTYCLTYTHTHRQWRNHMFATVPGSTNLMNMLNIVPWLKKTYIRSAITVGTYCKAGEVELWNELIKLFQMPPVAYKTSFIFLIKHLYIVNTIITAPWGV